MDNSKFLTSLVTGVVMMFTLPASGKERPPACTDGRFVVERPLVFWGGSDTLPITIGGGQVWVGDTCAPVAAKIKAKRKGTLIRATWSSCNAVAGPVRLKAVVTESCRTMTGSIVVKRVRLKLPFSATTPFEDVIVQGPAGPDVPFGVVLDGVLRTDPSGVLTGEVAVSYDTGGTATIVAADGTLVITAAGTTIDLTPSDSASIAIDGVSQPVEVALDAFAEAVGSGRVPTEWPPVAQSTLALLALATNDTFQRNVEAARTLGLVPLAGPAGLRTVVARATGADSFWCKVAAYSAAGAIAAVAGVGCTALTGSCALGTIFTFGGVAVPCAVAIGACAGGTFVGTKATYDLVLDWWATGAEPEVPPSLPPLANFVVRDSNGALVGTVVGFTRPGDQATVARFVDGRLLLFNVTGDGFVQGHPFDLIHGFTTDDCTGTPYVSVDDVFFEEFLAPFVRIRGMSGYYAVGVTGSRQIRSQRLFMEVEAAAECADFYDGTFSLPDICCWTLDTTWHYATEVATVNVGGFGLVPPFHVE